LITETSDLEKTSRELKFRYITTGKTFKLLNIGESPTAEGIVYIKRVNDEKYLMIG
jgi:hypothetical protein